MIVQGHRLCRDNGTPYPWEPSPNIYHNADGGETEMAPRLLVMHYTAGVNSLPWLISPESKASAHLLVSRCGLIVQLVAFNRCAWHASSKSVYKGRVNCNLFGIGIEMENLGRLERKGEQWIGPKGIVVPEAQVLVATHPHELTPTGWHTYTPEQREAVDEIVKTLTTHYDLEVCGHEDILAIKRDPGPAWWGGKVG